MENLIKKLGLIEGGHILDVASGKGEFIHTLNRVLRNYDEITGIDRSNKAIFVGKNEFKTNNEISFLRMDAYAMNFEDASFDTVSISNSLHHFAGISNVLHEMMRVLKPGGYLLINEMCCDEDQSEAQKNHIFLHHWWAKVDSCFGTVHNPTYTSEEIINLVARLELTEMERFEYSITIPDPKDENLTGKYLASMDSYIDPLKDKPEYRKLKEEAEMIKQRIREHGFSPARSVFFITRKKSLSDECCHRMAG